MHCSNYTQNLVYIDFVNSDLESEDLFSFRNIKKIMLAQKWKDQWKMFA